MTALLLLAFVALVLIGPDIVVTGVTIIAGWLHRIGGAA